MRVTQGGSFGGYMMSLLSADAYAVPPDRRDEGNGVRCARAP
jgi:hypothetical protein